MSAVYEARYYTSSAASLHVEVVKAVTYGEGYLSCAAVDVGRYWRGTGKEDCLSS